jgi:transcriptional antiterminator RfaH
MQEQWYVIQSKPRQEVKACQELQKQGYEVFLPTIQVDKVVKGRCIQKEEVLFSRYLFIQLNQMDSNWGPLRSTRGVSGLVRFGAAIPSLSAEQLKAMKDWVGHLPKQEYFSSGQLLEIIAGPFMGMQGIFEKLIKTSNGEERAIFLVELLGKTQQISAPLADLR